MSKLSAIIKYHSGTWEHGFNHNVAVRRLQEVEAETQHLKQTLHETLSTLSGILDDPEVLNVHKCHVSDEDIVCWYKALNHEQN